MRLVLLTLALGFGITAPVMAQTPDYRTYWPLAPGNSWVYAETRQSCRFNSCTTTSGAPEVWTTLDSVTVAAGRLPRIRVEQESFEPVECLVSFEPAAGGGEFLLLDATGDAPCNIGNPMMWGSPNHCEVRPGFYVAAGSLQTVVIGGVSYGERLTSGGLSDTCGVSIYTGWTWMATDEIGLLTSMRYGTASGGFSDSSVLELQWAHVDGQIYGTPVAAEADPRSPGLTLRVRPNPSPGPFTMQYELPSPARVYLEVVDALGREVRAVDVGARPAGTSADAVDLSGLAPGVYTVRLTAGEAVETARISVVR